MNSRFRHKRARPRCVPRFSVVGAKAQSTKLSLMVRYDAESYGWLQSHWRLEQYLYLADTVGTPASLIQQACSAHMLQKTKLA